MKKTLCAFCISGEPEIEEDLPMKVSLTVECGMQPENEGTSLVTLRQPEVMVMRKDMAIGYLNRVLFAILNS